MVALREFHRTVARSAQAVLHDCANSYLHEPRWRTDRYAISGTGPPLLWVGHWVGHLNLDWAMPVWRPWLDLLTSGATRDGNAIAQDRGVRAARLAAVKADVIGHVGDSGFTLGILAARQKISPRSVQLLFEREGTTFSQFLSEQRLLCAQRMLTDPRHSGVSISGVALASGFGDLSHFYRSFRRRYGTTPSDVRAAGLGKVKR